MMKQSVVLILLLCASLLLTGCWDRREVEELGIVHGIAIESAGNNRIRVVFQYINTSIQGGGGGGGSGENTITFQKPYRNQVIEADSVYDAVKQLPQETVARRFFAHTEVLIVSEEFARERGITEISDYISRDPQFKPNIWLLVGRGKDMASLMDTPGVISPIPTLRVSNVLEHQDVVSSYAPLRLGEFIRTLECTSEQPFTAVLEATPNPSRPVEAGHGILDGQVPEPANRLAINGTALFKNDKMVGWLNQQESRGLLWLRNEVKQGIIKFSLPGVENGMAATEIYRTHTKVTPVLKNGQIIVNVKIDAETVVQEVTRSFPMDDTEDIQKIEEAQNQAVIREVQSALDKAQKQMQVDPFGFGQAIHHKYPELWQQMRPDWDEVFPEIPVNLEVNTTIRLTNLTSRPIDFETEP
jgi:spore germination protein KC